MPDIVTRVVVARAGQLDCLAGLRRIRLMGSSYRKGQRPQARLGG
ncbi:MAG: hypothetical protein ACRDSG_02480 [Pseudonocardiaceae bacterium]